jgi:hypothetical protein
MPSDRAAAIRSHDRAKSRGLSDGWKIVDEFEAAEASYSKRRADSRGERYHGVENLRIDGGGLGKSHRF